MRLRRDRPAPSGTRRPTSPSPPTAAAVQWPQMMANAETATAAPDRLSELVGRLQRHEGFDQVVAALRAGDPATLDGVWGSSCALAAAALADQAPGPVIVVCPRSDDVDDLIDDLGLFCPITPKVGEKKGISPICAGHPSGRSGKLDLSPFLRGL